MSVPITAGGARFMRKVGWMLIAMVCPEIVMWMAIGQWEVVQEVCKRGKEIATRVNGRDKEVLQQTIYVFIHTN